MHLYVAAAQSWPTGFGNPMQLQLCAPLHAPLRSCSTILANWFWQSYAAAMYTWHLRDALAEEPPLIPTLRPFSLGLNFVLQMWAAHVCVSLFSVPTTLVHLTSRMLSQFASVPLLPDLIPANVSRVCDVCPTLPSLHIIVIRQLCLFLSSSSFQAWAL